MSFISLLCSPKTLWIRDSVSGYQSLPGTADAPFPGLCSTHVACELLVSQQQQQQHTIIITTNITTVITITPILTITLTLTLTNGTIGDRTITTTDVL